MEIIESIKKALKEMIVPELDKIKADVNETKAVLGVTNKRIDDISSQLIDQSRRIDSLREELSQRINETNGRIDELRKDVINRIDETNGRIDELRKDMINRIDETNNRLNRLYEVIVRKDEHKVLEQKVLELERDVREIKIKIAV